MNMSLPTKSVDIKNSVRMTHLKRAYHFSRSSVSRVLNRGFVPAPQLTTSFMHQRNGENRVIYTTSPSWAKSFAMHFTTVNDEPVKVSIGKHKHNITYLKQQVWGKSIDIPVQNLSELMYGVDQVCKKGSNHLVAWNNEKGGLITMKRTPIGDIIFTSSSNGLNEDIIKVYIDNVDIKALIKATDVCNMCVTTLQKSHEYCVKTIDEICKYYNDNSNSENKELLYKHVVEYFYEKVSQQCDLNITINQAMRLFVKQFSNLNNVLLDF